MLAQNCKSFLGSVSPLPSCWASHWLCVAGVRPTPAAILIPWTLQQSHHTQTMIETTRDNSRVPTSRDSNWEPCMYRSGQTIPLFLTITAPNKGLVFNANVRARPHDTTHIYTHTLLISADTLKHARLQRACLKCTQTKKRETSLQLFEIRFQAVFSVSSGLELESQIALIVPLCRNQDQYSRYLEA